jgi:exodeoxyribonuclease VII small subunit
MTGDQLSFEQAERELRAIVERLESGKVDVDEALALWERGEQLYAVCKERLDAAEGQIELLAERAQSAKDSA